MARGFFEPVVGHADTLCKGHLQQLIPQRDRFEDDVHTEPAGIGAQRFEFEELQLDGEGRVFHFESPGDLPVRFEFVEYSIGPENHIALGVGGFELPAAVSFGFELEHICAHPLRHEFGFAVRAEQQLDGQVELPRDPQFLSAGFGVYLCFSFHVIWALGGFS